jgi:hypothetical protein
MEIQLIDSAGKLACPKQQPAGLCNEYIQFKKGHYATTK